MARQKIGPSIGLALADLTPDTRDELNLPRSVTGAVVASVSPDKAAAAAGIQTGDVIVSVNDSPVRSARDVKNAIANAEQLRPQVGAAACRTRRQQNLRRRAVLGRLTPRTHQMLRRLVSPGCGASSPSASAVPADHGSSS